eukprot:gene2667-1665_t
MQMKALNKIILKNSNHNCPRAIINPQLAILKHLKIRSLQHESCTVLNAHHDKQFLETQRIHPHVVLSTKTYLLAQPPTYRSPNT